MKSYIKLIGPVVSLMLITGNVLGQTNALNGLAQQVAALNVTVSNLQASVKNQGTQNGTTVSNLLATVTNLMATVTALKTSNNDLSNRLQYVSVAGTDMFITGANLNIRNGSGVTANINGLGNLIVGYNESREPDGVDDRTGSHNIVIGTLQNFTSYAGLVAGTLNNIIAPYASVSAGTHNTASGSYASVSGGFGNTASGDSSAVSGGLGNEARGSTASVNGGILNIASGDSSAVSGGESSFAGGSYSSVSGGDNNTASGSHSSVSGGSSLVQTNDYGWTGGSYHTPP